MTVSSAKIAFFCAVVLVFSQPLSAKVISIVDMPDNYVSAGGSRKKGAGRYELPDKRCENFSGYLSEIPPHMDCDKVSPFSGITCYKNCRCQKGFTPDAGTNACSCAYGSDADCLCNSREYPLTPQSRFDYETYNYAKCKYGSYYKISGCRQDGYRLNGSKCVPDCAAGYSASLSVCGEDHKLVEQEGLPVCRKCEKITCPAPYTFVNDCPDGTRVSEHPSQPGCYKCEGVPCRGAFHTYNVCRVGQSRKTQSDNAACVYCEGTPCENGYNLKISCPAGQFLLRQESNLLCSKCSGTACANGYRMLSSCQDGQKMSVQENNSRCKKCDGAPCLAGYSTQTPVCGAGARLIVQSSNLRCRKCENIPR